MENNEDYQLSIFVEGKADKKFLTDYFLFLLSENNTQVNLLKEIGITIIETAGYTNLKDKHNEMEKQLDNGGVNLVMFDADDNYQKRLAELKADCQDYDCQFFLFPNNKDSGNLEVLLENIINPQNKPIFTCWDNYINCLQGINSTTKTKLTTPNDKAKIYAYLEALVNKNDSKKIKENNRNYRNNEHWDLTADYLTPLKEFLTQYIDEHQPNTN